MLLIPKVLEELSNGGRRKCVKIGDHFTSEFIREFNFSVSLDNLKPDEFEQRSFNGIAPTHLNSTRHSLQLAAKMVIFFSFNRFLTRMRDTRHEFQLVSGFRVLLKAR